MSWFGRRPEVPRDEPQCCSSPSLPSPPSIIDQLASAADDLDVYAARKRHEAALEGLIAQDCFAKAEAATEAADNAAKVAKNIRKHFAL